MKTKNEYKTPEKRREKIAEHAILNARKAHQDKKFYPLSEEEINDIEWQETYHLEISQVLNNTANP